MVLSPADDSAVSLSIPATVYFSPSVHLLPSPHLSVLISIYESAPARDITKNKLLCLLIKNECDYGGKISICL